MELSWLQNLHLILTRVTGACPQKSNWRGVAVSEVRHTLHCLADRREVSGGQRVVTNEHLVKACHYFDVRILVADADYDEPSPPGSDFFRDYYDDATREGITESLQAPSDNRSGPSSSRQMERQRARKNPASPTKTTIAIGKRKACEDAPSANSMAESRKAHRST